MFAYNMPVWGIANEIVTAKYMYPITVLCCGLKTGQPQVFCLTPQENYQDLKLCKPS